MKGFGLAKLGVLTMSAPISGPYGVVIDLIPGVGAWETTVYQHPDQQLWMIDQDRERAMAQRALERAARVGNEQPGLFRGGFTSLAKAIRGAASGAGSLHVGGPRKTTGPTGTTGV